MRKKIVITRLAGLISGLCLALPGVAQDVADQIWAGGPIITVNDKAPRAEAIAVKDGKILAVGNHDDIMKYEGAKTEVHDLQGRALLPGFVDAHGHAFMIGLQALSANLLSPPDGEVKNIDSLQQTLTRWAKDNAEREQKIGMILGFGYDDAQLAEQRHPTRQDLDKVSTDTPILIIHQSGHMGVMNSKALELAGITADTANPEGGVIRRESDGRTPNGVVEEAAFFNALAKKFGQIDAQQAQSLFVAGTGLLAKYGYTTGQEGRATSPLVPLMREAAAKGIIPIDVVTYVDVLQDRDFIAKHVSQEYKNGFRVGGAKLTIDGSPQGFTAYRDRPYYNPPESYRADYRGYTAATADQVFDAINWAFDNNIQIITHSNGEGASDILLAAIKTAQQKHKKADRRTVLIHGQFLREDQVDEMNQLDVFPSLFPMHTFYWGDWHRERTVGPKLANNISPTGWVRDRGMMFSTHHDAPVAFPDSMRVLSATVTRRSRSGDILGPEQRVDVMTALKAMTIWPAYQHFEEDQKGSLEPGKIADFVILSNDPTAVDPETLDELKVTETIKKGKSIFRLKDEKDNPEAANTAAAGDVLGTVLRKWERNLQQHAHNADNEHEHGPDLLMSVLMQGITKNQSVESPSVRDY
ncbi:amidohydrolase [Pusillimonas sp. DMV24BSW_D]|uniref:amidohydrolase n=1 Tax=Neopusillimonas aestuarii TaxID=2716226 RepID=UPI00140A09B7|nr:amidohydrolase [Pusillimonas sp. DMV24BSW_D]QIM50340.1 amidohydrolase [Pusillimonas sp. DMV24BSW_D]